MSKREKCAFVCVCAFEKRFWCAGEKGRYPGACRIDRSQRPPFDRMTTPDRSCATLSIISVCVCVYRVYTNVCGVCVCVFRRRRGTVESIPVLSVRRRKAGESSRNGRTERKEREARRGKSLKEGRKRDGESN